jgi:ATP-binding cassette subfamily B protein
MFTKEDLQQIEQQGLTQAQVEQQIENFRKGFPYLNIVRAAAAGDGVLVMSDEEIEKALDMAEVDFIESLDDGVSQGASNFSGGQKQRLQLARSVIAERDFYLFDDCFSALDMNTEAKVKENIRDLKENSSMLIVSQRISTIMDADEILVIDNGEIVDRGNHNKLIESCEIYREIVNIQIDSMEALS